METKLRILERFAGGPILYIGYSHNFEIELQKFATVNIIIGKLLENLDGIAWPGLSGKVYLKLEDLLPLLVAWLNRLWAYWREAMIS
ncbi:MAG: hypothetical protein FJ123_18250 [Deltaproteobacteria bacterium]|nr:hypothetical protein [Deltaproteobacteria bacterium]